MAHLSILGYFGMTERNGMGGRLRRESQREGMYVHLELIHIVVQQKLTHHCKAIILHLKEKYLGLIQTGFTRLYFRQMGQVR